MKTCDHSKCLLLQQFSTPSVIQGQLDLLITSVSLKESAS